MRLWRISTGRHIAPFGERTGACFVTPDNPGAALERICAARGIEICDVPRLAPSKLGPGLIAFDDSFVNVAAFEHFLAETRQPGAAALCLGDDALGRFLPSLRSDRPTCAGGARPTGLFVVDESLYAEDGDSLWAALCQRARPVPLPAADAEAEILPAFPGVRPRLELPRCRAVACHLEHWVHLLWLNQALAYSRGGRRGSARANIVAPDAEVHPTAYLERAVIGAGSRVEAHATVIDSVVGASCHVADHSVLVGSVLGDRCQTLTDTYLRRVVSMPGSTLSSLGMEEVLIGRRVFLTGAVIFFPTVQGEPAVVDTEHGRVATGRPRLGGCIGHDAVLGARAIFGPGQAIENGYTVVMRPEEGVGRIAPGTGAQVPSCWHRGQLLPIEQVQPGYHPPEVEDG